MIKEMSLKQFLGSLDSKFCYILCPAGIGDTYFICAYFRALESMLDSKFILVIQKNHKAILESFDLSGIALTDLRRWKLKQIPKNVLTSTPQNGKILPLHFHHLKKGECIKSDLKSSYLSLFQAVFNLHCELKIQKPKKINLDSKTLKYIESKILTHLDSKKLENLQLLETKDSKNFLKNCIFILPLANSVSSLLPCIFYALCEILSDKGYIILVNSTHRIYTHRNALNLDLSLREGIALSSEVRAVIGIRSGLFDVIASNCAKMQIFYPNESDLSIFSLVKCALSDTSRCKEILYESVLPHFNELSETLPFKMYNKVFLSRLKGFKATLMLPLELAKVYSRNKKNFMESSGDSIKQQIIQSYEYKLGLNLVNIYKSPFGIFKFLLNYPKREKSLKEIIAPKITQIVTHI